ncbi:MAG: formate dehydrogenase accessory sulfurtransferase FdhD [Bacteroidota bacterium]|nr:formate dehydrogenase accessory sulfurtransferase FdhD [Bacteroidota bacterium]
MKAPVTPVRVTRPTVGEDQYDDLLVTEEPLEIRLGHGPLEDRKEIRLSVTMRTPGHDEELALGFLYTEGIITSPEEVLRVVQCQNVKEEELGNVIRAELDHSIQLDPEKWQRNFYTTSSCGVCGKSSLDAVLVECDPIVPFGDIDPQMITGLPEKMRAAQTVFKHTGGIHAAALFDRNGTLRILREDIGRHNAVDKVIGEMLMNKIEPAGKMMLVSGRAGFELVQKCAVAGIPFMAAIGAPSSLAVDLARRTGMVLIGFLRGEQFNIYTP